MSENYPARRNPRLKGYDYSQEGSYFITICTRKRVEILSTVSEENVELSEIGRIVQSEWLRSQEIRKEIELDAFVIMPNHLHAIVKIRESTGRVHAKGLERHSLPSLIAGFKSSVTKVARTRGLVEKSFWQRGYYEHIIRGGEELLRIREYILANPSRWSTDRDNLERLISRMTAVG